MLTIITDVAATSGVSGDGLIGDVDGGDDVNDGGVGPFARPTPFFLTIARTSSYVTRYAFTRTAWHVLGATWAIDTYSFFTCRAKNIIVTRVNVIDTRSENVLIKVITYVTKM